MAWYCESVELYTRAWKNIAHVQEFIWYNDLSTEFVDETSIFSFFYFTFFTSCFLISSLFIVSRTKDLYILGNLGYLKCPFSSLWMDFLNTFYY